MKHIFLSVCKILHLKDAINDQYSYEEARNETHT